MHELLVSRRRALAGAVLLAAALLLGVRYLLPAQAASVDAAPLPAEATRAGVATVPRIVVDVVGAVQAPGLYRLAHGARIADAVARAGGTTRRADLEQVNLAAPVADGELVVVPRKLAGGGAVGGAVAATPSGPVSLSAATLEQLDALPGVGPVTAQKILDYRSAHGAFSSVDELDAISGIGPARLDTLRGLVVP